MFFRKSLPVALSKPHAAAEVDPMQSVVSDNFAAERETFFFPARGLQKVL